MELTYQPSRVQSDSLLADIQFAALMDAEFDQ